MAKKLDDTKVKMGNLIPVSNTERKTGELESYYAVKMEDQTGKDERWYLLTGNEISRLVVAEVYGSKDFKAGRLYYRNRIGGGKGWRSFVLLNFPSEKGGKQTVQPMVVTMPDALLKRAFDRAKRNAEDIPEMSWLEDLKD